MSINVHIRNGDHPFTHTVFMLDHWQSNTLTGPQANTLAERACKLKHQELVSLGGQPVSRSGSDPNRKMAVTKAQSPSDPAPDVSEIGLIISS